MSTLSFFHTIAELTRQQTLAGLGWPINPTCGQGRNQSCSRPCLETSSADLAQSAGLGTSSATHMSKKMGSYWKRQDLYKEGQEKEATKTSIAKGWLLVRSIYIGIPFADFPSSKAT